MFSDEFGNIIQSIDEYSLDELMFLVKFFNNELYINQMSINLGYGDLDHLILLDDMLLDFRDYIRENIDKKLKEN